MLQRTDMCVDGEAVQWTRSKPHVGDRGAALAKQSAALEGDTRTLPQRGSIRPFMLLPSTCPNECVCLAVAGALRALHSNCIACTLYIRVGDRKCFLTPGQPPPR